MRAGQATGQAGTRTARRGGSVARASGAALLATAAKIEASTVAAIGAGKARTAAFVRRASATTHRTGARTASGTARAIRRGGGRATVATRRGTRRAARATRRAATHLVPDPVALHDDDAPGSQAGPGPEPATVAAGSLPAQAIDAGPRATAVVSPGDEPSPIRRPRQGQVVPLRPRATTRLKATGELLVLVAFLGIAVSSIIVAIVVAANQVLSGL